MTSSPRLALGIDLGGTKIEGAIFELCANEPRELVRRRIATPRGEGYQAIVEAVAALVRGLANEAGLRLLPPVGVGMPGSVTRRTGLVKNSNTTCLNGRPFREDLASLLDVEVRFANDANCFALAEARYGAGRGHDEGVVFGVIMGTGVGGGWVLRGKVWDGPQGIGGEWGHHTLQPGGEACYCGRAGCVERYLSGPAIEARYAERTGIARRLVEIASRVEREAAAREVLDEALVLFGRALGNVISIIDPDVVVIGGGVSNVAQLYTEGRARVAEHVFNDELLTPIVPAQLGDASGVLGAALLVA